MKAKRCERCAHLRRFEVRSPPVANAVIDHPVLLNTILTAQYLSNTQSQSKLNTPNKNFRKHTLEAQRLVVIRDVDQDYSGTAFLFFLRIFV